MKKNLALVVVTVITLFFISCSEEPTLKFKDTEALDANSALSTETIEISLSWYGTEDLDLHVVEPNGNHLYFGELKSNSGASLICSDPICSDKRQLHIESFSYPENAVPKGKFSVYVDLYGTCGGKMPEWTLTIKTSEKETIHVNKIDMVLGDDLSEPSVEPFSFSIL